MVNTSINIGAAPDPTKYDHEQTTIAQTVANRSYVAMLDSIPDALLNERRWVGARVEERDGSTAKIPYNPHQPKRKASTSDPTTWADYATVRRLVGDGTFQLAGFVLGNGFVGVDLDECRDSEGTVAPWARDIIEEFDSYNEVSLSETGVHIICRGTLPTAGRRAGHVEMYASGRYFVMTGNGTEQDVADRSDVLPRLYERLFPSQATDTAADDTDDELLDRIRASVEGPKFQRLWSGDTTGYESSSEADAALCVILARWTKRNSEAIDRLFRLSALYRRKWERLDYRQRTIAYALNVTSKPSHAEDGADSDTSSRYGASRSEATRLVKMVTDDPNAELFQWDRTPYITVEGVTMEIRSSQFADWLRYRHFEQRQRAVSSTTISDAVGTLAGLTRKDGRSHEVFVRVAGQRETVHLDLGEPGIVEVTGAGWTILPRSDVRFMRSPGFQSLPTPVRSDSRLETLLGAFLNVRNESDMMLLIGWLVRALRGRAEYPILNLTGEAGSAKTSASRFLRRLVDPSRADVKSSVRDDRDLMIAARNSFVIALDNQSRLDNWLSDRLCGLATGTATATRALCTNTDEIIIDAARPIILNGINDVVKNADLNARTVAVTLDYIPDERRKTNDEMEAAFLSVQPLILGRLLDAVSCSLRHEVSRRPSAVSRMAGFVTTVAAAEPALGWADGAFQTVYNETQRQSVAANLDGNLVGRAVRGMDGQRWSGTAKQLLAHLRFNNRDADHRDFPRHERSLTNQLRMVMPGLRQVGIDVVFQKGHNRTITIERRTPPADDANR